MAEPQIRYDEPSDTLYISFASGRPARGLELNEHLLLRIDPQRQEAVGLTILNYSLLAQPTQMGPRSFALTGLGELAGPLQDLALRLLQASPVSEFLAVSAYTPAGDPSEILPIVALRPERIAPRAA